MFLHVAESCRSLEVLEGIDNATELLEELHPLISCNESFVTVKYVYNIFVTTHTKIFNLS